MMDAAEGLAIIARLQKWRGPKPGSEPSALGDSLGVLRKRFRKSFKGSDAACAAWASCVPSALAARTSFESLRDGSLRVLVDDSAALFELQRELGEPGGAGLLARLREASGGKLLEVRLRFGRMTDAADERKALEPHEEALLEDET